MGGASAGVAPFDLKLIALLTSVNSATLGYTTDYKGESRQNAT